MVAPTDDPILVGGVNAKGVLQEAIQCSAHGFRRIATLHLALEKILANELWRYASTSRREGKPFTGFWEWAKSPLPDGMEVKPENLIRMMVPWPDICRKLMDLKVEQSGPAPEKGGPSINPAGRRGKDEGEGTMGVTHTVNPADRKSAQGILARLKRDAPEIAQAFVEGKYPSAAAAGRAAGIPWLQKKSHLEKVLALLPKLTPDELEAVRGALP